MFSIIIVLPKQEDANNIKSLLVRNGFEVNAVCTAGAQAVSIANGLDEGIVISGYRLPDMSFREIHGYLPKGFEMLLIASAARLEEASGSGIMAIGMPLKTRDLVDTLRIMTRECARRRRRECAGSKERNGAERELIEKAKLILMHRNHISEEEAHRYLKKNSMESGVKLIEMAEMIISML